MMIATAERLRDLRRVAATPVEYPSEDFYAAQTFLAASVPELLDTVEGLCRVIVADREAAVAKCWCASQEYGPND